jgi:hypothetical protein
MKYIGKYLSGEILLTRHFDACAKINQWFNFVFKSIAKGK